MVLDLDCHHALFTLVVDFIDSRKRDLFNPKASFSMPQIHEATIMINTANFKTH